MGIRPCAAQPSNGRADKQDVTEVVGTEQHHPRPGRQRYRRGQPCGGAPRARRDAHEPSTPARSPIAHGGSPP